LSTGAIKNYLHSDCEIWKNLCCCISVGRYVALILAIF